MANPITGATGSVTLSNGKQFIFQNVSITVGQGIVEFTGIGDTQVKRCANGVTDVSGEAAGIVTDGTVSSPFDLAQATATLTTTYSNGHSRTDAVIFGQPTVQQVAAGIVAFRVPFYGTGSAASTTPSWT